jgi:hypothetical protein
VKSQLANTKNNIKILKAEKALEEEKVMFLEDKKPKKDKKTPKKDKKDKKTPKKDKKNKKDKKTPRRKKKPSRTKNKRFYERSPKKS